MVQTNYGDTPSRPKTNQPIVLHDSVFNIRNALVNLSNSHLENDKIKQMINAVLLLEEVEKYIDKNHGKVPLNKLKDVIKEIANYDNR